MKNITKEEMNIKEFFEKYPNGVAFGVKIEGKNICHFEALDLNMYKVI